MRRFPMAFLLVGVMSLLAAGGAVLGAFQAPTGVDLAVHNSAGETLLASRVTGDVTSSQLAGTVISFDFTAPDHATEEAISSSGKVEERQKVSGSKALEVLGPVRALLSSQAFKVHGSSYAARHFRKLGQTSGGATVTETRRTLVQLAGGYVVSVVQDLELKEGAHHLEETSDYRLTRVDGWTRSQ